MKHLLTLYTPVVFFVTSFLCTISWQSLRCTDTSIITQAPISCGELIDKITILEIKADHIKNSEKLHNIHNELDALMHVYNQLPHSPQVEILKLTLKKINLLLWDIEDEIRQKEHQQCFDDTFIELARQVYITNDKRAEIKRTINLLLGSHLMEEKSYTNLLKY